MPSPPNNPPGMDTAASSNILDTAPAPTAPPAGKPVAGKPADGRLAPTLQDASASRAPGADAFRIKGRLTGTLKQVADALRTLTFLEVAQEKDAIEVAYIEKRDINKNPYLFSILRISANEMEVLFSIPPAMAPHKRRLDVVMHLLNILGLIEPYYTVDNQLIYPLLENALRELSEAISPEYAQLYTAYDTLKKENADLRKRITRLGDEVQALTSRNFELKSRDDELRLRLQTLESLSDAALKNRLQEWVLEHNGEINIYEFCKVNHISESRVEEALNQLVNEGYLSTVQ